ncbi:MAG: hypothetical protein NVSMB16_15160 [Acidimicrobiales bacterium]
MARRHPLLDAVAPVAAALGADIVPVARMRRGDLPLAWEGVVVGGLRPPVVQGTLDRLVSAVERELGGELKGLSREDKQVAVQLLDERGAFQLRRAIEEIADRFQPRDLVLVEAFDPYSRTLP